MLMDKMELKEQLQKKLTTKNHIKSDLIREEGLQTVKCKDDEEEEKTEVKKEEDKKRGINPGF